MKTSIKQLWKGMIPVRSVYVNPALKAKKDLSVYVKKEDKTYVLTFEQLKTPRGITPIRDDFSNKMQKLLYYGIVKAKEEDKQQKLL